MPLPFVYLKNRGFTLIEIIIAVTIIGLVAAMAMPNLRNFNKTQELEAAAANLVQALKKTQSNAMSRIACPSGKPTSAWKIAITETGYQQTAVCTDLTGESLPTPQPFPFQNFTPSAISMYSNNCLDQTSTVEIEYTGNNVAFRCINSGVPQPNSGPIQIILKDTGDAKWVININKSGLIDKEQKFDEI